MRLLGPPAGRVRRAIEYGVLAALLVVLAAVAVRAAGSLLQEDARIPSWGAVDRAAPQSGATGGEWLSRAKAQVLGEAPQLRMVARQGPTENDPPAGTGESSALAG